MRQVELPGSNKTLSIRESPRELPINRYADFQKYLVQQAGLGSDMPAVEAHFSRVFRFMAGAFYEDATRELYNMYQNIHLMLNKIDIESVAFGCLVDSITSYPDPKNRERKEVEKIEDYSEQGLINLCVRLGAYGLTKELVSEVVSDVKKKSILA
jgi:hypothetical protein